MCGRFTIDIPPALLAELFGLVDPPDLPPRFNIAPTQQIPVIRQYADGENHLDSLRWGIPLSSTGEKPASKPIINARSETVSEKPMFRQAIRYRRCIIPSSGFYEWKQDGKTKQPWYIRMKDGAPMMFAGLWNPWKSPEGAMVECCAILTTASNSLIEPSHARMPVILHPDDYRMWLYRQPTDMAVLGHVFKPYPAELMEMWQVSPLVNSVKNDSAELVLPTQERSATTVHSEAEKAEVE